MNQTQDLVALGQNQFDKAMRLSSLLLANAERLANLQLELSRKMLNDNAETFKALSEVKDAKALSEVHSNLVQPRIDQAFAAAREVYDVTLTTQSELSQFVEEQLSDMSKSVMGTLDQFAKNAPGGSEAAVNAMKQFVSSTGAAFESASETARKVGTQFAEASVEAASSSAQAASAAVSRATTSKRPNASA